jgi:hypothetical protein
MAKESPAHLCNIAITAAHWMPKNSDAAQHSKAEIN